MSRREASPARNSASSANIARINETTGDYLGNDRFDLNEDFWTRDYLKPEIQAALAAGSERPSSPPRSF